MHLIMKKGQYKSSNPYRTIKSPPFKIVDGMKLVIEIANPDSVELYRGVINVTSGGELYLPVKVQNLIEDWD